MQSLLKIWRELDINKTIILRPKSSVDLQTIFDDLEKSYTYQQLDLYNYNKNSDDYKHFYFYMTKTEIIDTWNTETTISYGMKFNDEDVFSVYIYESEKFRTDKISSFNTRFKRILHNHMGKLDIEII